jgi:hypothetical protein
MIYTFLGDISLNDYYKKLAEEQANPFEHIQEYLAAKDFVVGNLEAISEGSSGINRLKKTRISTNKKALQYLNNLNVRAVSLANNHLFDNLEEGIDITIDSLNSQEILSTGAGSKTQDYISDKNKEVAIISYVSEETTPSVPPEYEKFINLYDIEAIENQTKQLKADGFKKVILLIHWGVDNSHYPSPKQRKEARKLVLMGVDIIIGHHSHVLQGMEKINGALVFYSLGNFCFSPLLETDKKHEVDHGRQTKSIILDIDLNEMTFSHKHFIQNKDFTLSFIKSRLFQKVTRRLSLISNPIIWPIYMLYLNFFYKIYFYFLGNNRNPFNQLRNLNLKKVKKYLLRILKL